MNSPDPTTTTTSMRTVSTRTLLIALVVAVLVGIGLYFAGLMQGRAELAAQKTQYEQQLTSGRATLDQAKAQLAATQNRNHLMVAQVALYRTAIDLDQRNFGIANDRLQKAAAGLAQIKSNAGDIDTAKIAALRSEIASSNINVATDLQTQRDAILSFAQRLDAVAGQAR